MFHAENLPKSFSIGMTHHVWEGDGPKLDQVVIYGDGHALFQITFEYHINGSDADESVKLKCLTSFTPDDLPFIQTSIHLIAKIHDWMCDMLNEQDEQFFNDVFLDEDDERVMYSINELMLG